MGDIFFVYIIENELGDFYIGHTTDLNKRLETHNNKRGSRFTSARGEFRLVYQEKFGTLLESINREKQLKKWSRAKKEALIKGDLELLKKL